jgi:hypothetical protein
MDVRKLLPVLLMIAALPASSLPANEQKISPEKLELIKEIVKATDTKVMYHKLLQSSFPAIWKEFKDEIPRMKDLMTEYIRKEFGEPTEADKKAIDQIIIKNNLYFEGKVWGVLMEYPPIEQAMEEIYYPLYDTNFSEDELKEILRFFQSDAGHKFLSLGFRVHHETVQTWYRLYNNALRERILAFKDKTTSDLLENMKRLDKTKRWEGM